MRRIDRETAMRILEGFARFLLMTTTLQTQPLDLAREWTHGQHLVSYEEIALRCDQADYAAFFLHRSAMFLMAVAMKDAGGFI